MHPATRLAGPAKRKHRAVERSCFVLVGGQKSSALAHAFGDFRFPATHFPFPTLNR